MKECNACVVRDCVIMWKLRKVLERVPPKQEAIDMAKQSCRLAVLPAQYKVQMLNSALMKNAQGVHDVLQEHNLFIRESSRYPYYSVGVRAQ